MVDTKPYSLACELASALSLLLRGNVTVRSTTDLLVLYLSVSGACFLINARCPNCKLIWQLT